MTLPRLPIPRRVAPAALLLQAAILSGCRRADYPQSALNPESDYARLLQGLLEAQVFWVVVIFALVQLLLLVAVIRFRARPGAPDPKPVHGNTALEIAWTIAPAIVLALIAVPTVAIIYKTQAEIPKNAMIVKVIGHQWWWEFRYPAQGVVTAGEMHAPAGQPVVVEIESADVLHSFWIPAMGGKRDAIPNQTNRFYFTADHAGEYPGQCAELCGLSHANMRMKLFVQTPVDFEAWVAAQKAPAATPDSTTLAWKGLQLFKQSPCIACHTVDGVSGGIVGPNLTHVGGRTTIAGAIYPNDTEHLTQWISNAPARKPGSIMPALGLPSDQVTAIVAYLQTLR